MTNIDRLNVPGVDAPYSRIRSIELAGRESFALRVSIDHPYQWVNSIFENSRCATFMWHKSEGKMLLVTANHRMGKFRKQNCKSMDEFCSKVNTYLTKQS
jgi:hypothetical protein